MDTNAHIPSPADAETAVLCLLNPGAHSDGAADMRDRLSQAFAHAGRRVRIEMPGNSDLLDRLAREAVRARAKVVIAGGGDGTMNAVANVLAGSETALGILPLGTLNHFAKDLGIPLEIDAAVANIFAGRVREVDVGDVNGRVFVNNSSIGLYPQIVREREALQEQGHGKWMAFAQALVAVLRRSPAMRVRLIAPSRTLRLKTEFIFIGNNEYELSAPRIGARARLDGGELWVYRVAHAGRFRAIAAALRAFLRIERPEAPFAFSTPELELAPRRPSVDVAIDGEVVRMQTPLRYRSRPRALRAIVPAEGAA